MFSDLCGPFVQDGVWPRRGRSQRLAGCVSSSPVSYLNRKKGVKSFTFNNQEQQCCGI